MPKEPGQARIEGLEAGDAFRNLCSTLGDEPGQLGGAVCAVSRVAPPSDPGGVLERQVKTAQVDQ